MRIVFAAAIVNIIPEDGESYSGRVHGVALLVAYLFTQKGESLSAPSGSVFRNNARVETEDRLMRLPVRVLGVAVIDRHSRVLLEIPKDLHR